jgi:hypothetical protein
METRCPVGLLERAGIRRQGHHIWKYDVMAAPSETYNVSREVQFVCCKELTYLVYFNVRYDFCRWKFAGVSANGRRWTQPTYLSNVRVYRNIKCICTRRTSVSDQDTSSVSRETGSFKSLCLSPGAGATGYRVRCSKSGMGKRCLSSSNMSRPMLGPPSLLYDGYRFLGAFAKLRQVSVSFVMSVRPPEWCLMCVLATKLKMADEDRSWIIQEDSTELNES